VAQEASGMSEKRIVVPDGMLEAVEQNIDSCIDIDSCGIWSILAVALRWLSENPIVPTLPQLRAVESAAAHEPIGSTGWLSDVLQEWVRRMFLAPEAKVPDEEIGDLLVKAGEEVMSLAPGARGSTGWQWYTPHEAEAHNKAVLEAFRRGQKSSLARDPASV
jgi:hypothetical protein